MSERQVNQMSSRIYYSKEAERIAKREQTLSIAVFLALGLGIGAVLALMFAPRKGQETREAIADALEDGYRRGIEATQEALQDLEPEVPDLRKRIERLIHKN